VGGSGLEHAGHRLLPGEGSRVYGRVEDRARERRGVEGTGEGGRTATMNLCRDNREGEPPTAFSEPKAAAPPQVVRVIGGGLAGRGRGVDAGAPGRGGGAPRGGAR